MRSVDLELCETPKLLACPFCGSDDIDAQGWLANDQRTGPSCMNCGATGESVDAWNKRAPAKRRQYVHDEKA